MLAFPVTTVAGAPGYPATAAHPQLSHVQNRPAAQRLNCPQGTGVCLVPWTSWVPHMVPPSASSDVEPPKPGMQLYRFESLTKYDVCSAHHPAHASVCDRKNLSRVPSQVTP